MLHIYYPSTHHVATYFPQHELTAAKEEAATSLLLLSPFARGMRTLSVTLGMGEAGVRREVAALTHARGAVLVLPTDADVDEPLLAVSSSVSSSAT